MQPFLTLTALALIGYGLLVGALYAGQRSLLYFPSSHRRLPAASGVHEMAVVTLVTGDGLVLRSWYAAAEANRPTIVYLHGNGGDIGMRGARVRPYLDAGLGMLLVEYRGYGGNPGQPTEAGLYADGRAAMAFLAAAAVPPASTVLYGESLGCAVAVQVASESARAGRPVGAVILEAPLSSVTDVAAHHYPLVPVRWLLKDRFDAIGAIATIGAPLLIAHGDADAVVPIRYGKALFAAAQEPKEALWIAGGEHENLDALGLPAAALDFITRRVRPLPALGPRGAVTLEMR